MSSPLALVLSSLPAGEQDSDQRSAALEIRTGQVIISETRSLDVFGDYFITQHRNGEVALYKRGKGVQAKIVLRGK